MTTKYNIKIGDGRTIPIDRTMCGITVLDSLIIYAGRTKPMLLSIKQKINGEEQVAVDSKFNLVLCPTYRFNFANYGRDYKLEIEAIRKWQSLTKIMPKLDTMNPGLKYNLSEIDSFLQLEEAVPYLIRGL